MIEAIGAFLTMSTHTTALLVVDVQVGLIEGDKPVYQGDLIMQRIGALIAKAHAAGAPVVYVQDKDVGGVGTPEWQIHPAVAPAEGDLVVRKAWGDAFFETELHSELQSRGVAGLVITGMKTDMCVTLTSMRAIALGYEVSLAADAHTTTDNRVLTAAQTIAYHNDLLWGFGEEDGFGERKRRIEIKQSSEIEFAEAPTNA
jgi:nicotinamidase-related amidase